MCSFSLFFFLRHMYAHAQTSHDNSFDSNEHRNEDPEFRSYFSLWPNINFTISIVDRIQTTKFRIFLLISFSLLFRRTRIYSFIFTEQHNEFRCERRTFNESERSTNFRCFSGVCMRASKGKNIFEFTRCSPNTWDDSRTHDCSIWLPFRYWNVHSKT